jgi:fluoroacetyl-CoA thioesterase
VCWASKRQREPKFATSLRALRVSATVLCCVVESAELVLQMAKPVPVGARGSAEERVQFDKTLTAHHHELPPVYSTPDLIRLMETAGFHALQPFCDAGEISVGTAINIEHRAPSGINAVVKAEAVVEKVEGRFITLQVTAHEGKNEVGRGTVTRSIVEVEKFLKKYGISKP